MQNPLAMSVIPLCLRHPVATLMESLRALSFLQLDVALPPRVLSQQHADVLDVCKNPRSQTRAWKLDAC